MASHRHATVMDSAFGFSRGPKGSHLFLESFYTKRRARHWPRPSPTNNLTLTSPTLSCAASHGRLVLNAVRAGLSLCFMLACLLGWSSGGSAHGNLDFDLDSGIWKQLARFHRHISTALQPGGSRAGQRQTSHAAKATSPVSPRQSRRASRSHAMRSKAHPSVRRAEQNWDGWLELVMSFLDDDDPPRRRRGQACPSAVLA
jgi:hypothetical protein